MTKGLTLMATTTDCEVCSTPRLISDVDVVTAAPLPASPDEGVVDKGVDGAAIPDASWYSSEVSEALDARVSFSETSFTA